MDADDDKHQSSSFIKQSNPKLIIKFAGRNIIHQQQQQQQQCSNSSKEAEELKKNMSVSNHNLSISNSPKSISNNSDSPPTCSICGKSFPSKQSLFGHMRSHPEREWRGIQPPPTPSSPLDQSLSVRVLIKKNSPASTDSDDSRKSLEESYQGVGPLPVNWSATGKRGRRPYGMFISSDERIDDAVIGLLMLKEGNDLDIAFMNKQISRETEGISMKKRKKRMILESSSEDVSRSSELLRSSKKIKIDQERSCGSTRDGFDPKLQISNIQSSQLEQLPAAASNMFQEDCGLVMKNNSKKVKLADERISCGSSSKLINSIHSSHLEEQYSSKKLKVDDGRGCSSARGMFDPKPINSITQSNHLEQMSKSPLEWMYSNGFHGNGDVSKLLNSISSSSHMEQMPPNGGYFQGGFNSVFLKPAILMKSTASKKKAKEIDRVSSADQNMSMQVASSTNEFKCDTCNRTFPSHQALGGHKSSQRNCKNNNGSYQFPTHLDDHQYQYLQCRESMFQAADQEYITETKTPTTSSYVGTHRCELCGATFGTGQALGGHKRRHYTGGLSTSGTVNSTAMAQTDQLTAMTHYTGGLNTSGTVPVNSSTTMAQIDQLTVMAQTEKLIKKEEMNRLSVVAVASSSGEEVISTTTTTTTTTKTENKPTVLDFDLNELPDEMPDDSWRS